MGRSARPDEASGLDRRRGRTWIVGLAVLVALVSACSPAEESSVSKEAAVTGGRWTLPAHIASIGAKVRLTYDGAPAWTTARACGGKLRPGSNVLGEYLMDHFASISSVGGYSCRPNTADAKRMSVHGTGRAIDVFIPTVDGAPNGAEGDEVANWLVENAQSIGVQLIIWDRSMWRANGTNDVPYGGPRPHTDHIHVELTSEAAARSTRWFGDGGDGGDGDDGGDDGGDGGADAGHEAGEVDAADSGTEPDADVDAGAEPEPPPPPADAGKDSAPPVEEPAPSTPGNGPSEPRPDALGDEPGETNSLPHRPATRKTPSTSNDAEPPNDGCSAAPGSQDPMHAMGTGLALVLGLGAWLRRSRRQR